jgi:hypothetical protein
MCIGQSSGIRHQLAMEFLHLYFQEFFIDFVCGCFDCFPVDWCFLLGFGLGWLLASLRFSLVELPSLPWNDLGNSQCRSNGSVVALDTCDGVAVGEYF